MRNIIKAVCVIIGTIIGAGFASGKEIYLFFNTYGEKGILGIIIASILTGVIIYKVLMQIRKIEASNYKEYLNQMKIKPVIKDVLNIIINIFLLMSFYIMIAGFAAYFEQEWHIPNYLGTAIIIILCSFIFLGNIERLMKINTILVPILIIAIILLISKNMDVFNIIGETSKQISPINAIWDAVIYSSYNSIILIPILLPLQKCLKQKSLFLITAIICTIILIILSISIFGLILKVDIDINKVELPTVYVASMMGKGYKIIYGIVILVAIYTSAISAGYGFLEKYKDKKQYRNIVIIMSIIAFFTSNLGFTTLLNLLYPIFGILGLVQIVLILKKT